MQEFYDLIAPCDMCGGDGECTCECGDIHECHQCDGSGKSINIRNLYEKKLRAEVNCLLAYKLFVDGKKETGESA
uniref:Uncharacterized protein n=1 Tax=viral metagenome TaxID=1070528 RepID=A0A6M3KTK3_9ZZZZ